jgi:hypothetical protein
VNDIFRRCNSLYNFLGRELDPAGGDELCQSLVGGHFLVEESNPAVERIDARAENGDSVLCSSLCINGLDEL